MKKTIAFAVSVILCFVCLAVAVEAVQAQNWYCPRNKDNKQPIFGSDLSYVSDFGGYYIDLAHSDESDNKVVYLTFDAGYENGNVERILDVMKEKNVTGAFFILENLVVKAPDLVSRMADEGHLVCNHTADHVDVTGLDDIDQFRTELESLENVYRDATGRELAKYFRPPEGRFDRRTLEWASQIGYKTVFWSFAYADWDNGKQMSAAAAKKKILDNVHNGAVILLHPTSKTNADILGDVIDELKAQGYRFGTLDMLTEN